MTDQNDSQNNIEAARGESPASPMIGEAQPQALPSPPRPSVPSSSSTGISLRIDSKVVGLLLIGIGVLMLLGTIFHISIARFLWPFIFILPGVALFVIALKIEGGMGEPLAIIASIITMLGLLFLFQSLSGAWASWAYAWSLIAPTAVGLGQIIYGMVKSQDYTVKTGMTLVKVGITIFLVGFIFFELIIGISGFGFGRLVWPVLLILLGLYLLFRNLITGQRG